MIIVHKDKILVYKDDIDDTDLLMMLYKTMKITKEE